MAISAEGGGARWWSREANGTGGDNTSPRAPRRSTSQVWGMIEGGCMEAEGRGAGYIGFEGTKHGGC